MPNRIFILMLASISFLAACEGPSNIVDSSTSPVNSAVSNPIDTTAVVSLQSLSAGKYPIQGVQYDNSSGIYTIKLFPQTPAGQDQQVKILNSPQSQTQLAPLSLTEIQAGQKSFAKVAEDVVTLYLARDFKIYFEPGEIANDQEQESPESIEQSQTTWVPFAGSNVSSSPQYYFPPAYNQNGLSGFGAAGSSYASSINNYQAKYKSAPPSIVNASKSSNSGGASFGSSNFSGARSSGTSATSSYSGSSSSSRSGFGSTGAASGGSSSS